MTFVRQFGILVLGLVLLVSGFAGNAFAPPPASLGWTAYAPLTSTTFVPTEFANLPAVVTALVGFALVAGWIGFSIGRRKPR